MRLIPRTLAWFEKEYPRHYDNAPLPNDPTAEMWARLIESSNATTGHRPKRKAERFYFWLGSEAEGL